MAQVSQDYSRSCRTSRSKGEKASKHQAFVSSCRFYLIKILQNALLHVKQDKMNFIDPAQGNSNVTAASVVHTDGIGKEGRKKKKNYVYKTKLYIY